jgi:hypothetical protein
VSNDEREHGVEHDYESNDEESEAGAKVRDARFVVSRYSLFPADPTSNEHSTAYEVPQTSWRRRSCLQAEAAVV